MSGLQSECLVEEHPVTRHASTAALRAGLETETLTRVELDALVAIRVDDLLDPLRDQRAPIDELTHVPERFHRCVELVSRPHHKVLIEQQQIAPRCRLEQVGFDVLTGSYHRELKCRELAAALLGVHVAEG